MSTRSLGARSAAINLDKNHSSDLDLDINPTNNHHQPSEENSDNLESQEKRKRLHEKIETLTKLESHSNLKAGDMTSSLENENRTIGSMSVNEEALLKTDDGNVLEAWSYPVGEDLEPSGGLHGILQDEMELLKSLEEEKLTTEVEEEMPWEARALNTRSPSPLSCQSPSSAPPLLAPPFAPNAQPLIQPPPPMDLPADGEHVVEDKAVHRQERKEALSEESLDPNTSACPSFPPSSPLPASRDSPNLPASKISTSPHLPPFTTSPLEGKHKTSYSSNNNNDKNNVNSYNIIACESYFKTKPSPTEEEIITFIECMKVPIEVVQKYLASRKLPGKESAMDEGVKGHRVVLRPYRVVSRPLNFTNNQILKMQPSQPPAQAEPNSPVAFQGEQTAQANHSSTNQSDQLEPNHGTVASSLPGLQNPVQPAMSPTLPMAPMAKPIQPSQPPSMASSIFPHPPISHQSQPISLHSKTYMKPFEEKRNNPTKVNPASVNKQPGVVNQVLRLQRRPAVERVRKELTMIFGADKIFCTLEDLKPLAPNDPRALKRIFEDMSRQGKVQVVSEEFCRGLANGSQEPLGHRAPPRQQAPPPPTYPAPLLPPQTSCPPLSPPQNALPSASTLSTQNLSGSENGQMPIGNPTDSQEGVHSNKRSRPDSEAGSLQAKKIKIEEEVEEDEKDDSGYLTNFDASSLNLGEASFNNMIKENVGEVNMLDDTLGLLDLSSMDIVDNMFDQLPEERKSTYDDMEMDRGDGTKVKIEVKEEEMSDLRKLFHEKGVSPDFSLSVMNVKQGFKKNILEVELSDGFEVSSNFFFKVVPDGQEELTRGLRVRMTSMRSIGARICVDAFDIVGRCDQGDLGAMPNIEEEFYVKLRRWRLEDCNLFDIPTPKSLNDYIELEETVLNYIAGHGGKKSPLKTLFSLSTSQATLSPRLAKLLATHLEMSRAEVESYLDLEKRQPQPVVALLHDHDYCDLASTLA